MATKNGATKQDITTTALVEAKKEAAVAQRRVSQTLVLAEALAVTNEERAEQAAAMIRTVRDVAKEAERLRKSVTGPLDTAKKACMALFKPGLDEAAKVERILRGKLTAYNTKVESERRAKEQELAQAAAEAERKLNTLKTAKARNKAVTALAEVETARLEAAEVRATPAGVHMRPHYSGEVVAAWLIPSDYLIPDEAKLLEATREAGGDPGIPGWTGALEMRPVIR